jgi:O-antigen/teichoic acid export membrane protein
VPDTILRGEPSNTLYLAPDSGDIITAAKGGSIIFFGTLFEYVGRFLFGIVVARFIGAEQFGVYNLALTPLNILSVLALLGLQASMVRYIPIFARHREEEKLWGTIQAGVGLTAIVSIILGVGLFISAESLATRIFHTPELTIFLRVAGLIVPFVALIEILSSATQGFKRMEYTVYARDISVTMVKLILAVVLLALGFSTLGVMVAHASATILACVMLLYFLHRLFPLNRPVVAAQRDVKQQLSFSLPIYLSQVIDILGSNLGILLLGMLNTAFGVGIFSAAARLSLVGKLFHRSIVNVSQPIVSDLHSKGDMGQLERFYQVMTKWTLTANLPLFLTIVIFPGPILSIFGHDFSAGATALVVLALGFLIDAGTGICGVVINMTGHTRLNVVNSILVVTLTLALNIWLIPAFGIIGAAIAAAVATSALNLARLIEVFALFRLLPYNRSFAKPMLAALTTTLATLTIKHWAFTGTSLVYLFLNAALLLIIYAATILLLGLSREDRLVLRRLQVRLRAVL